MAIVKMNKFSLLAFEKDKEALLEKLQAFERVQISDIDDEELKQLTQLKKDSSSTEISEVEGKLAKLQFIIELLGKYEKKPNLIKSLKEGKKVYTYGELEKMVSSINWEQIYSELQQKSKSINQNNNEITKLTALKNQLESWIFLDTPLDDYKELRSSKVLLGAIPSTELSSLRLSVENTFKTAYLEAIGDNGKDANIMVIAHNSQANEIEAAMKISGFVKSPLRSKKAPKEELFDLSASINKHIEQNNIIEEEIIEYLKRLYELQGVYEYYSLYLERLQATDKFLRSNSMVAMQGYYPAEVEEELESLMKETLEDRYYLESVEAEGDDVPVLLKNNKVFAAFEDITSMFSVPKYNEIDPTPLFAPFYIFFFGMMLSDAGYGALIAIGTFIALRFFNLDEKMEKSMRMFFYLGLSTVFWGVMYGSYFGDFFDLFFEVKALWMKPDANVALLMIVAVAMGLIQIYVGLGIKAYMQIRDKDYFGAFADVLLWYITLTGCILWGLSAFGVELPAFLVNVSKYSALASMVGIVLTNGREATTIGGKLGQGFYSLYGITSYVGDLVSYTRLAALGLATGFISYAFNVMLQMVSMNIFTTIVFGGAIFIVGHIFNLFINALGAYVHTSRLQYLEYFGKFYEGGGRAFEPLKYKTKYYKIMKNND